MGSGSMTTDVKIELLISNIKYSCDSATSDEIVDSMLRNAIAEYEQSKWVRFDVNDESTYPPIASGYINRSIQVITNDGDICEFIHTSKQWVYILNNEIDLVSHWQPLPEFKE